MVKKQLDALRQALLPDLSLRGISRGSLIMGLGSKLTGAFFNHRRQTLKSQEPLIDNMSAYDLGKGAGRLMGRWLEYHQPAVELAEHQQTLKDLLLRMDEVEPDFSERAQNRFLVSKALFYLGSLRLGQQPYEAVQEEAVRLLRTLPEHKRLSKKDVFLGAPFAVETLIGHAHGLLLGLVDKKGQPQLEKFLKQYADSNPLDEAADYYAQLVALTFPYETEENPDELAARLDRVMMRWFEDYQAFQLEQTRRQEKFTMGALAVASGQAPGIAGIEALKKLTGKK